MTRKGMALIRGDKCEGQVKRHKLLHQSPLRIMKVSSRHMSYQYELPGITCQKSGVDHP
jgi:hypothetical protein